MLTFNPGSVCDVCAEEYGPDRRPHSIACGHVLCWACCNAIVEKTSPRLTPVCPFCREQFSSDSVRLIRVDFASSSGVSTPRRPPTSLESNEIFFGEDVGPMRKQDREIAMDLQGYVLRARAEARRLEDKVAEVAKKKCSVEEVNALHNELREWLKNWKPDDKTSSLQLSAALLRAILLNHLAHSEATKAAKSLEASLKAKIDDLEMSKSKLEVDLNRQKSALSQKTQECTSLRAELNRLKTSRAGSTLGISSSSASSVSTYSGSTYSSSRPGSISSISPPTSPPTSTASSQYYPPHPYPALARPLSSSASASAASQQSQSHSRSTSLHQQLLRDHFRSNTPAQAAPPISPATPKPPVPPKPSGFDAYPGRHIPSPAPTPKLTRSTSDGRDSRDRLSVGQTHQRWIPSINASADEQAYRTANSRHSTSTSGSYLSGNGSSRTTAAAAASLQPRYTISS